MEKYGVVTETENTKIAAREGRPCPQCGFTDVNYKGSTPHCARCGTEPWEKKHASNQKERGRR